MGWALAKTFKQLSFSSSLLEQQTCDEITCAGKLCFCSEVLGWAKIILHSKRNAQPDYLAE
jgi:hypothetical protein